MKCKRIREENDSIKATDFANIIYNLRVEHNLTQKELADKIQVSDRTISKWENGQTVPDLINIKTICDELGVSPSSLVNSKRTMKDHFRNFNKHITKIMSICFRNMFFIFFIISFILLLIYFINNYNSMSIYLLKYDSEDINIGHGYFVESKTTKILVIDDIKLNKINYEPKDIKLEFGDAGIQDLYIPSKAKVAEITDDTQMTMFTADGLIKSARKVLNLEKMPDMRTIFDSYKLWINTQSLIPRVQKGEGWIPELKALYKRRSPGTTCTSSLRSDIPGSIEKPLNSSSGCGGVMRVAPVGLMYKDNPELAFKVGAECAALTHGNPRAYLSAGVHSEMISHIISGNDVETAVDKTMKTLATYKGHEPVTKLMNKAKELAKSDIHPEEAIEQLGEGWVGDEAIAISTYCALKEPNNFEKALKMAVNHSGDSDSTGAIVGNILGAHLGVENIPEKWHNATELSGELEQLATDLFVNPKEIVNASERYPIH